MQKQFASMSETQTRAAQAQESRTTNLEKMMEQFITAANKGHNDLRSAQTDQDQRATLAQQDFKAALETTAANLASGLAASTQVLQDANSKLVSDVQALQGKMSADLQAGLTSVMEVQDNKIKQLWGMVQEQKEEPQNPEDKRRKCPGGLLGRMQAELSAREVAERNRIETEEANRLAEEHRRQEEEKQRQANLDLLARDAELDDPMTAKENGAENGVQTPRRAEGGARTRETSRTPKRETKESKEEHLSETIVVDEEPAASAAVGEPANPSVAGDTVQPPLGVAEGAKLVV